MLCNRYFCFFSSALRVKSNRVYRLDVIVRFTGLWLCNLYGIRSTGHLHMNSSVMLTFSFGFGNFVIDTWETTNILLVFSRELCDDFWWIGRGYVNDWFYRIHELTIFHLHMSGWLSECGWGIVLCYFIL